MGSEQMPNDFFNSFQILDNNMLLQFLPNQRFSMQEVCLGFEGEFISTGDHLRIQNGPLHQPCNPGFDDGRKIGKLSSQKPKHEIGIYASDDVVEHDADSPFHGAIYEPGRKGLHYIEKAKKKKSPDGARKGKRGKSHRDQIPDTFVDDNLRAISFGKDQLGPFRCPNAEKKCRCDSHAIQKGGIGGKENKRQYSPEGPHGPRGERTESGITKRCKKDNESQQAVPSAGDRILKIAPRRSSNSHALLISYPFKSGKSRDPNTAFGAI